MTTTDTTNNAATGRVTELATTADALADQIVVAAGHTTSGLDALPDLLGAVDRIVAAAVTIVQGTDRRQVIRDHGITIDAWLRAIARRTGADAGMLLAAADRLADMPAVSAWFTDGTLTWGAVRAIVSATRHLTAEQRTWLDHTLAADRQAITSLDADQLIATVDHLAGTARPDLVRDRAERTFAHRYLAIQPALDGTARVHGTLDPETTAVALAAFDTTRTHDGRDGSERHGDDDGGEQVVGRHQTNVDILNALCRQRVTRRSPSSVGRDEPASHSDSAELHSGGANADKRADAADRFHDVCDSCGASPSSARPAMLVVADIGAIAGATAPDALASATAQLLWRSNHVPIELTSDAAQRLACDATLRVVLTNGAVPLGVGATHPKVSASLRAALVVRDGACRFTACAQPADRCDAHHLAPVANGGATTLANLALLCRAHHRAVHEGGWTAVLHTDATMTFTRRGSTLTSLPRAAQRIQPHSSPPHGRPHRPRRRRQPEDGDRVGTRADTGGADQPVADRGDRDDQLRAGSAGGAAPPHPLPF